MLSNPGSESCHSSGRDQMPLKNSPKMKFRIKTEEAKPMAIPPGVTNVPVTGNLILHCAPHLYPPDHARTSLVSGVSPSLAPHAPCSHVCRVPNCSQGEERSQLTQDSPPDKLHLELLSADLGLHLALRVHVCNHPMFLHDSLRKSIWGKT